MHNGLIITSLSLYPIKYLNKFFEPYGSSLETNILLTSMSSILITYFFFWRKSLFLILLSPNFTLLPLILIMDEKKVNSFYNNLGVQGVIIYFYGNSKQISIFLEF